jgi:flagellin
MVQTAEASIAAASEMGQRILTLATQGANSTLGLDERWAIQVEMSKLLDAIDSIGGRTKFSGNPLLDVEICADPTASKYTLQVSRESDDKIYLTNDAFLNIGFGTDSNTETAVFSLSGDLLDGQSITIGGRTVTIDVSATKQEVMDAFTTGATVEGAVLDAPGSGWTFAEDTDGNLVVTRTIDGDVDDLNISFVGGVLAEQISYVQGGDSTYGQASWLKFSVEDLGDALDEEDLDAITESFNDIQSNAQDYVIALGAQRSSLGALQNQIEYTVSNVTELSANLSAARSRVQDTDYAAETANLTKGQILQQAATAMLAQANQMPNVILTLLK